MTRKDLKLNPGALANLIVLLVAISFFFFFYKFEVVAAHVANFVDVCSPFILGFIIAYLLNAPVKYFRSTIFRRVSCGNGLSIALTYLLSVVGLAILVQLILPQAVDSVLQIGDNLQIYIANLDNLVSQIEGWLGIEGEGLESLVTSYGELLNRISALVSMAIPSLSNLSDAIPTLLDFGVALGSSLVTGVIMVLTAVISSIYMLSEKTRTISQGKRILYAFGQKRHVDWFLDICSRSNQIFAGFINGKLLDSAIIGVLCFLLCNIIQVPFAVLIGVIVGVTNVIPFFGPFIGAIPCLMILVVVDPWAALRFAILVIALQQFDGNILGPKILGDSTGISAIWVLVSIVVGGGLFGFTGMLLGVPTFAVLYMIVKEIVAARLAARGIDEDGNPLEFPPYE